MADTMQVLEKKLPRPKSVAEAITMDSALDYTPLNAVLYNKVTQDTEIVEVEFEGMILRESILNQIRQYKQRSEGFPKIISYDGYPVRAVSSLFKKIPLEDIWREATGILGEPIVEQATSQAIVTQFSPVFSNYDRSGNPTQEHHELKPTILFSYNFAERSFQLGFVIGVFQCANQLFFFCSSMKTRIVHNVYQMANFNLKRSIKSFADNFQTVESMIEKSQTTAIANYDVPVMYWKSMAGTQRYLKKVFEEPTPKTQWQAMMNVTKVSTHDTSNFNVGFDISTRCGQYLCKTGSLFPDDYVLSLGYYMRAMRRSEDDFWRNIKLNPLKGKVRELVRFPQHTQLPVPNNNNNNKPPIVIEVT